MGMWCFNTLDLFKQCVRLIRRKIAMMFIRFDPDYILTFIGFRVKLRGIDVVFDPEHLHRTGFRGSQEHRLFR